MKLDQVKKVIRHPRILLSRLWVFISPLIQSSEVYLKAFFWMRTGKVLNLKDPHSFQEKTQWLKLHSTNPLFSTLVDKYEVRRFVAERIGEEYLIPLLGVYDRVDDIDISKLPNQFVLKTTHDSGSVIVCRDKSSFNFSYAKRKLRRSLKRNYYYIGREYPYKTVKPRIVAEQYLVDDSLSGGQLPDYKFFTFNGEPKLLFLAEGRFSPQGARFTYFDMTWNELPVRSTGHLGDGAPSEAKIPKCFDEMVKVVKKLCLDIPFLRIDLYSANNKVYFGEYTFFHDGGVVEFEPEEWNIKLGDMINLPLDENSH